MQIFKRRIILTSIGGLLFFSIALFYVLAVLTPIKQPKIYGVTFSSSYAEKFGLNWKDTYTALLDDLGVRHIRIPVHWDEIEPADNSFDFSRIDWQVEEAKKRDTHILLAVGKKLPRWPECHIPEWAKTLSPEDQNEKLLRYISISILRYRDSSAISAWQIENEPFLPFGECPEMQKNLLENEIALVRALDSRPVVITDSGELSSWLPSLKHADIFGSTLYRIAWNDTFNRHISYPLPASFYRAKQTFARLFGEAKPMIVTELQGETWNKKMPYEISVEEQYISMNPDRFQKILSYASRTGFDTFYLWGVEWWYALKINHNDPRMWDIAKQAILSTAESR